MIFGFGSIRHRIIALSLLLAGMLLSAALYTEKRVQDAAKRYQTSVVQQQAFTSDLGALKNAIYTMESGVYRYAVLQDVSARASVEAQLDSIKVRTSSLSESALARDDGKSFSELRPGPGRPRHFGAGLRQGYGNCPPKTPPAAGHAGADAGDGPDLIGCRPGTGPRHRGFSARISRPSSGVATWAPKLSTMVFARSTSWAFRARSSMCRR